MEPELEQALPIFLAESRDLLEGMEEILLRLETGAADNEAINSLFRAAHTIKGTAGIFGLDEVVSFTHLVENVLDRVRDGSVRIDGELVALSLKCRDHIALMIEQIASQQGTEPGTVLAGAALAERLKAYLDGQTASVPVRTEAREGRVEVCGEGRVASETWHISLRFGPDVLRNGMDPLSFLRYLRTLGEVTAIITLHDAMPDAATMDPESCYLGFEINLDSNADKQAIESVFEFVREDCSLRILPPHSRIQDYLALIDDMSCANGRLGEILIQSGAITREELKQGLDEQQRQESGSAVPLGEVLIAQKSVQPEVVGAALEKQRQSRDSCGQEQRFVRVSAEKLDHLINLVGELVIACDGIQLHAQRLEDEKLNESSSLVGRLVSETRDGALQLRMVPIGETFNRFHRVVRDVSRELGKDIRLEISGADTEMDKSVVEKIGDPLMHLVRNAMDHGIESAATRQSMGKPETGMLRLNAYHDSGSIVIEVGDDGSGISADRIRKKAIERGLIAAEQEMSRQQILNLIFEPGFSTAEQVTNLSGRGVGMDVVRRNIEALRGVVEMDSREGSGTTVRIRLPLTLAIIDAFQMRTGNGAFVVPLESVVECVELEEATGRGSHCMTLRDEVLPLLRLREMFDIQGARPRREYVVVVQFGAGRAGLVVERLQGELQAVIKPVARLFGSLRGISGTTILGSGEVALILDVAALVQRAMALERQDAVGSLQRASV